jgi:hypothetical protein
VWVDPDSERFELGRVVEGARVVEQKSIPVDGGEQGHGLLDDAIGESVGGQRVVTEFSFDGGMGGAQGDDGDLAGVCEQVEAADLRGFPQDGRAEGIAHHDAPPE